MFVLQLIRNDGNFSTLVLILFKSSKYILNTFQFIIEEHFLLNIFKVLVSITVLILKLPHFSILRRDTCTYSAILHSMQNVESFDFTFKIQFTDAGNYKKTPEEQFPVLSSKLSIDFCRASFC